LKKAFNSDKTLWVKTGTQKRLAAIKEEDEDNMVVESIGSEPSISAAFDPVEVRTTR